MKSLFLLIVLFSATGCSNKAIYDTLQGNQQFECKNLPPSQYEDCINTPTKPFNAYESERKEVLTP